MNVSEEDYQKVLQRLNWSLELINVQRSRIDKLETFGLSRDALDRIIDEKIRDARSTLDNRIYFVTDRVSGYARQLEKIEQKVDNLQYKQKKITIKKIIKKHKKRR